MNTLHICSSFFESSVYNCLLSKLEEQGVSNYVYVPKYHQHTNDTRKRLYIVDKKFSKLSKLFYWGEQKYLLNDVQKQVDISKIEIIHSHRILYGGYVALQLKKKYGIPYIVSIRNSDLYGWGRNISIYKKHCFEIMSNAEKIVFISNTYKNEVSTIYNLNYNRNELYKKFIVIPNGIDDYFIKNIAIPNHVRCHKGIKILTIGDVDKNKNALTTLKACNILSERGINVEYHFAGRIKDKKIFKKIVSKDYSYYHGMLNREQVRELLLESDIFVMPSIHETFGLVYAEAMSQGVPIIYTRGQGFDGQYAEGEVGYSVDCFNAKELADRIFDIHCDYENISNRCIMYSQRYSWKKIASSYIEIYQ